MTETCHFTQQWGSLPNFFKAIIFVRGVTASLTQARQQLIKKGVCESLSGSRIFMNRMELSYEQISKQTERKSGQSEAGHTNTLCT